ncbi:CRISPR-associated helicase/endonuclease Cas3 [Saccharospirillum impatiens]|uniref:CRISPR-associated helicase/endonuclease Cas3 n=1 Tax=Saccharospirillum impatiens TaxID=169438 RepID=UPI0004084A51|nr:CRISPR-associated helicase/endonuclease Cas3 [Saccharospirillum impatiens]
MKYNLYIGKAQQPEATVNVHLLPFHLMDVAAVGYQVLKAKPQLACDLADLLDLTIEEVEALLVFGLLMHDLGKMTASFQSLFEEAGYTLVELPPGASYDGKNGRHDQMGYDVWKDIGLPDDLGRQLEDRVVRKHLRYFLSLFWGHHGKPINDGYSRPDSSKFTVHDRLAVSEWLADSLGLLNVSPPWNKLSSKDLFTQLKRGSWLIAGFSTYCDWVGSDNSVFEYCDQPCSPNDYWINTALPRAKRALAKTEVFEPVGVVPFGSFKQMFSFSPSPLQQFAAALPISASPQLVIFEDITGSGKTEAALTVAHRLLEAGNGDGFYFGLPTMATSNAMFGRVADVYNRMLKQEDNRPVSLVLAHGARDMNDLFQEAKLGEGRQERPYQKSEETASMHCGGWLADSRKKALLAPVGVGTIDQVLLAVLPKKHQSLRVLGLYRKVLILDEVHAADTYMLELLDSLLKLHAQQGGSVVMLTATLTMAQRARLTRTWQEALDMPESAWRKPSSSAFPLATVVSNEHGLQEQPVEHRPQTRKDIPVSFLHTDDDCIDVILTAAEKGQCVVWVRNSVDEAIAAYRRLKECHPTPEKCLLFHSRYVLQHRKDKEAWVMRHFGKESTPEDRAGYVLVATQVFQESLDADADLMISDLCLIDDLIQRAGRLHRHVRDAEGAPVPEASQDQRARPTLYVHAPAWQEDPAKDWLIEHSRNTQYVYQTPGRIWLTMRYLRDSGRLELPERSREMIESVYGPEAEIPSGLTLAEQEYMGKERASKSQGRFSRLDLDKGYSANSSQIWTDDNIEVGTRLGEEAREVVLVKLEDGVYRPLVSDRSFAVELSTARVSSPKLLASFAEISNEHRQEFVRTFKRAKFSLICCVADVPYSEEIGLESAATE